MRQHAGSFDFILDTIAAEHDINAYIQMLGLDGNITLVGAPETPLPVSAFALIRSKTQSIRCTLVISLVRAFARIFIRVTSLGSCSVR